jgi:predicted enzyme related to lactoylglutathione lyase
MLITAKYVHTNLIARDWRKLSQFYKDVFGFKPVQPERHYKSAEVERGTGVLGSELHGVHLRAPGYGDNGPTLEILTYSILKEGPVPAVNRPGFGHIALSVSDVNEARSVVLKAGGKAVGEVDTALTAVGTKVTWCYVTDPEGNAIELQSLGKS